MNNDSKLRGLYENEISIFVYFLDFQVNTSGEENKNGFSPNSVKEAAFHLKEKCPNLK